MEQHHATQSSVRGAPVGSTDGQRLVLIVDDDADVRAAMRDVLEDEGFQVIEAGDGMAALSRLRTQPRPCVVLLDMMMPIMDGWTFLERRYREPALSSVPVVIVSAAGQSVHPPALSALGAVGILTKPVGVDELLQVVQQHC